MSPHVRSEHREVILLLRFADAIIEYFDMHSEAKRSKIGFIISSLVVITPEKSFVHA